MRIALAFLVVLLAAPQRGAAADTALDALRAALAAAVSERLGGGDVTVDVEVLQAPATMPQAKSAAPVAGARLGQAMRFVVTPAAGLTFSVVARVSAVVNHAVAVRALARDAAVSDLDVEWRHDVLAGVLLEPLPALDEIRAAHTRRAIAAGEVLTRAALLRPYAVRAGDAITLTIRSGAVVVSGIGRAVSSGYVGDVIRIMPPGSRQPSRARVVAPAAVEILQ